MNLPNAVISGFRNYANFSGRASRSEFWYWTLAYMLVMLPLNVLDFVQNAGTQMGTTSWVVTILTFGLLIPNTAVAVRRLHDTDRSGWWLLISFTVVALPLLIYWYCVQGTKGANRFGGGEGASPKPRLRQAWVLTDDLMPAGAVA